jgi:16S rRNA (guanine527-N7)-methyltransferase
MQEGTPSQPAPVDWAAVHGKLAVYLDLILKWNARTNLTAIRQPEEIVRRHFGESLFLGTHLGHCATLLDFGSGAGLPGIPVQLMRPDVHVTLAESQGKKAAFLREVVRELALTSEVWAARVEQMEPERKFDAVAMRAVDRMADAVREGSAHARQKMLVLGSSEVADYLGLRDGFATVNAIPLPELRDGVLVIALR